MRFLASLLATVFAVLRPWKLLRPLQYKRLPRTTLTSPDGHYRITGLPAGALTVIATAHGHEPAAAALLGRPGGVPERDFVLAAMGPARPEPPGSEQP